MTRMLLNPSLASACCDQTALVPDHSIRSIRTLWMEWTGIKAIPHHRHRHRPEGLDAKHLCLHPEGPQMG